MTRERKIKVVYLTINLKEAGFGDKKIVFLHGWGRGGASFSNLVNNLLKEPKITRNFKFYIPDLPGFGKSSKPKKIWGLRDYCIFLKNFLAKIKAKKVIIIAHSFGGQIAGYFSILEEKKVERLILIAPALIRKKTVIAQLAQKIPTKIKKIITSIPLLRKVIIRLMGARDYEQASPKMKKIMRRIIKEDLTQLLDKIKVPTLLIWGEYDNICPPTQGILIKKKIPNSQLIFVRGTKHNPHIDRPEEVTHLIKEFIL